MVGVPGRSKACHICRQRRIKCGGERPGCHNCVKSGRLCTGYQRKHAFILSRDMVDSPGEPSQDLSVCSDEADSGEVHVSRWRAGQRKGNTATTGRSPPSTSPTMVHPVKALGVPGQVNQRPAFREQFFSLFLNDTFPAFRAPVTRTVASSWIFEILNLPSLSPALENATLAVCVARMGKRDRNQILVRQSLPLYTKALSEFSRELGRKSSCQEEQTLAACMVMMVYEVYECPGGNPEAYQAHYKGTMKLLELRGPDAHQTGLAHSIFQSLRVHTMFQAFVQRSGTMLSAPEWLEAPFTEPKEHFDQLLDILLDIPRLYPQHKRVFKMTNPREQFSSTLGAIHAGLDLEKRLEEWYKDFKETVGGPLYHPELSRREYAVDNDSLGKLFPVAYRFPAFSVAQNVIFYWTALVSVHSQLSWMYQTLSHLMETLDLIRADLPCACDSNCLRHFEMSLLPPIGDRPNWPRTIAYDICRSLEYCLEDHGRSFGPLSTLPVLSVVKVHWMKWPGDFTREIAWANEVFSELGQERSIIAQFLR